MNNDWVKQLTPKELELDKEYLARPELDVKFEYNKSWIYIASEHTCYLRYEKMAKLNQKELLDSYSNVIKLCREMGIKIKYGFKYKKFITENWQEYLTQYVNYENHFNKLLPMLLVLQGRGLHKGTSDDIYLKSVLEQSEKINSFYFRNSILYQMRHIYHELGTIENDLIFERNCKHPEAHICGKTISITL